MVAADAVSALDEVLSRKEMSILKTPLCGYRTFADFLDATPYEHRIVNKQIAADFH